MDLTTQHPSIDYSSRYFDVTIRSTLTLDDLKPSSPINPNDAFLTAFKDKEKTYLPLLTSLKPPGFIFKVLAFNTFGAAHQNVHDLLSELQNKAHFRLPHPTAFNATNFLSYASQRLSILVNIGTAEIIKRALVLADPGSTSTFS
jgi:hypothetical protein